MSRFDKPTPSVVPHADSIAPSESHTERYRSPSRPDHCLYAMLSFIGYAWSRMLCATAARLRTVVRVSGFRFFCSYLVLSALYRRPLLPYSCTYTQQRMLTPRVISSLPSVVLTHGITNGSLFPECLLFVQPTAYLGVIFFRPPVWYVFIWHDVSASHRK